MGVVWGWLCPWVVVPKDTRLDALGNESQKVITDVQVLFGALMNNIFDGADMTIYHMRENLRETEMNLFSICMLINCHCKFTKCLSMLIMHPVLYLIHVKWISIV